MFSFLIIKMSSTSEEIFVKCLKLIKSIITKHQLYYCMYQIALTCLSSSVLTNEVMAVDMWLCNTHISTFQDMQKIHKDTQAQIPTCRQTPGKLNPVNFERKCIFGPCTYIKDMLVLNMPAEFTDNIFLFFFATIFPHGN